MSDSSGGVCEVNRVKLSWSMTIGQRYVMANQCQDWQRFSGPRLTLRPSFAGIVNGKINNGFLHRLVDVI